MAYMAAVIVMFFGQVEARELLSLTARGMVLFYGGWFCVRHGSRGPAKASREGGETNACRTGEGIAKTSEASRKGAQRAP
jgi:hypothetical protein